MLIPLLFVLLGLVLLFFGGDGLVRGSSALALRLGLTPLVVGLTVVAFGTSAPELVVSVQATLAGQGAVAIGNVIGSNILNIGLILGLTALIYPLKIQLQLLRIDMPIMIGATLVAAWMLSDLAIGRAEGAVLFAGIIAYVSFTVVYAQRATISPEVTAEFAIVVPKPHGSIWIDVLFIASGLGLLAGGSHFLVNGATQLARNFGISEAIIGLTIVSLGTSMPELMTCIVAAMKKQPDIALGNIIGSNIFNLLGILGAASLIQPMTGEGIKMTDLYVAIAFSVALVPILWRGSHMQRWEGGVLLAGYVLYVMTLWPAAKSETDSGSGIHVALNYPFRAVGNEPGWLLVVTDSLLTLRWDYDEHRADLPSPQIAQTAGGKRITASRDTPQDTLRVVVDIRDTRCADGMSGQQFPATVSVHVNGRSLNGCGGNPVEMLADGTWEVTTLHGKPLLASSRISMEFSRDGKLTGMAGCNRYTTSFAVSPEGMHVDAPAVTRMTCGDAMDQQEQDFLALLESTQHYLLDEQGTLTVSNASGGYVVARRDSTSVRSHHQTAHGTE